MSSGTLDMSSDGGILYVGNDSTQRTLSISGGTFQVTGTSASTYPLVTKGPLSSGTGANYAFTVSGGTLNLNGLRVQNANASGMNIATTTTASVTFTAFRNVRFTSNKGGTGSTHLGIAYSSNLSADFTLTTSGCMFDTTATSNVTTSAQDGGSNKFGAYFIFDLDSGSGLGGEGESRDSDGDAGPDGIVDNFRNNATVVSWPSAAPGDIAGSAVGFPTAAFDWNTFKFYSVYATFSGAATNTDRIYVRNADGSAHYSYDIDTSTYGNVIGTSLWDTVNETGSFDVNGNGTLLETNLHILYVSTTGGHIFKLIDNGSSLALPGTGSTWHTPFPTSAEALPSPPSARRSRRTGPTSTSAAPPAGTTCSGSRSRRAAAPATEPTTASPPRRSARSGTTSAGRRRPSPPRSPPPRSAATSTSSPPRRTPSTGTTSRRRR
jgi:hypothetical protein